MHILITVWLYHNTFYNNAYHNNYFFMPNFHDAMDKPWWLCRKDMSEGQKWYQKSKLRLQPNRKIIFWFVLAIKYEEKSLLGWKHLSKVKDWKTNKLSFWCIILSWDCLWNHLEPGYFPKRSDLMHNNFFTWKCNFHRNFC